MKILITGGAGFIGSFLVDELIKQGHKVVVFDNLDEQTHPGGKLPDYFNKEALFIKGDVRDIDELKNSLPGVEAIFHFAAMVGIAQSQYQIKKYTDVNIGGTANLLEILANQKHSVKKIIAASSMILYGEGLYQCSKCGLIKPPFRQNSEAGQWEPLCHLCQGALIHQPTPETTALAPNSVYAITKRTQEEMFLNFGGLYDIPAVAFRFFNVYGPRQSLSNPYTGVSAIFLSRLKNNQPPVIFEDGRQTRDFISVHDVVRANLLALDKDIQGVFNVASGQPIAIKSVADMLIRKNKAVLEAEISGDFRKNDIRHCYADISKIKKELGWEPLIAFEQGIDELIEWSKNEAACDLFEKSRQELKDKKII